MKTLAKYLGLLSLLLLPLLAQMMEAQTRVTPPVILNDRDWDGWSASSLADIEAQFNAARRLEEQNEGLANGTLGNLDLPDDYFSRSVEEQSWIILKAEREARHLVNYPGTGVVTGFLPEGVESSLSTVARLHAEDMAARGYFSHNTLGGPAWSTRIRNAFPNCEEGIGENIAYSWWSNGYIYNVALSFYNFIYDDWNCCQGGHRNLCLKQTGTNNYGDPERIGLFGFGSGRNGNFNYLVMDYIDPIPGCTYNIQTFEADCNLPAIVDVNGAIYSNEHLAENIVNSAGTVMANQTVSFKAGDEINLQNNFEVQANTTFTAEIEECPGSTAKAQNKNLMVATMESIQKFDIVRDGMPRFQSSHQSDFKGAPKQSIIMQQ